MNDRSLPQTFIVRDLREEILQADFLVLGGRGAAAAAAQRATKSGQPAAAAAAAVSARPARGRAARRGGRGAIADRSRVEEETVTAFSESRLDMGGE